MAQRGRKVLLSHMGRIPGHHLSSVPPYYHLFGQWQLFGVVTFGGVYHPPAAEQSAGQGRQGAQLLWLLMDFRNNHSLLPLSKQTQGEVRRCKYSIQCNRGIPLTQANTLQASVNRFFNHTVHGFGLGYGWRAACSFCTRVLAGRFYLRIRESFWQIFFVCT